MAQLKRYIRDNHLAFLALFLALGGTSYAAVSLERDSVGSKQIRKGAVTSDEVRNRSLLAEDFKGGELPRGRRGATGAAGARGATGPAGPAGPAGAAGKDGQPGQAGGAAGGSLTGSYPNPGIANGAVGPDQLGQVPSVRLVRGSGTSYSVRDVSTVTQQNAGETVIPWRTPPANPTPGQSYDNGGFFSATPTTACTDETGGAGTDPLDVNKCIVFPRSGVYAISAGLRWAANATGRRTVRISGGGGRIFAAQSTLAVTDTGAPTLVSASTTERFTAGQFAYVGSEQSSGAALNVAGSLQQVYFTATWLGP